MPFPTPGQEIHPTSCLTLSQLKILISKIHTLITKFPLKFQLKRDKIITMIKTSIKPIDEIIKLQRKWAEKRFGNIKNIYLEDINNNLFMPLMKETENEYRKADGKELKKNGKMYALHSSSALVVNFFQYWRIIKDVNTVSKALELGEHYNKLIFEKKYQKPKPIKGNKPNVDIELLTSNVKTYMPIPIESKFCEIYRREKKTIKKSYIDDGNRYIWENIEELLNLAKEIYNNEYEYFYFDAPQIIKHFLGYKTEYNDIKGKIKLIYLWYDFKSEESKIHKKEISHFVERLNNSIELKIMTYQELFQKVKILCKNKHNKYIKYSEKRYFENTKLR